MPQPLRFVIQHHVREPDPHFDLMLERDGELVTFQLPEPLAPGRREVRLLEPHRLDYLAYEGEVSGGRGTVSIRDRGTYETVAWEEGRMVVRLQGDDHVGRLVAEHVTRDRWELAWTPGLD